MQPTHSKTRVRHGLTRRGNKHPLYWRWTQMRARCENPNSDRFKYYGGRGIKLCGRWKTFMNFFNDMNPSFKDGMTLERKDNNGDYSPENCVWSDWKTQQNNKRSNHYLEFHGLLLTVNEWAEVLGVAHGRLHYRLRAGMPIEKVLADSRLPKGPKSSERWDASLKK